MISHFSRSWWGHSLIMSLYYSYALKSVSPSVCLNVVIWFLNTVVLLGGKYLAKNAFLSSFQVLMEFAGRDCSRALALSLREKGKRHKQMASGSTSLLFNMSVYCTNTDRWRLGSSVGLLENGYVSLSVAKKVSIRKCLSRLQVKQCLSVARPRMEQRSP